jgi:hypothetical protein
MEEMNETESLRRMIEEYPTIDSAIVDKNWRVLPYLMSRKVRVNNPSNVAFQLVKNKGNDEYLIDLYIRSYPENARSLQYPGAFFNNAMVLTKSIRAHRGISAYDVASGYLDRGDVHGLRTFMSRMRQDSRSRVASSLILRAIEARMNDAAIMLLELIPPSSYQNIAENAAGNHRYEVVRHIITTYPNHITNMSRIAEIAASFGYTDIIHMMERMNIPLDHRYIGYGAILGGNVHTGIQILREHRIPIDWSFVRRVEHTLVRDE